MRNPVHLKKTRAPPNKETSVAFCLDRVPEIGGSKMGSVDVQHFVGLEVQISWQVCFVDLE